MTVSLALYPALSADLETDPSPPQFATSREPPAVAYDDTTSESAYFAGPVPGHYEPGDPLGLVMAWRPETLTSAGRAIFQIEIAPIYPYEIYDSVSLGTPVVVEIAPNDPLISDIDQIQYAHFDFLTAAEINGIQPNMWILMRVTRLPADAADNHQDDVEVIDLHLVTDLFDPATWDPVVGATLQWYHDARDFSSLGFSGSEVNSVLDQTSNNIDLTPGSKGPTYDAVAVGSRPGLVYDDEDLISAAQGLVAEDDFTFICVWTPTGSAGAIYDVNKLIDIFDLEAQNSVLETNIEERDTNNNTTPFTTVIDKPIISVVWNESAMTRLGYRINGGPAQYASYTSFPTADTEFKIGHFDTGDFRWSMGFMYLGMLDFDTMNDIFVRLASEFNVELTIPLATS